MVKLSVRSATSRRSKGLVVAAAAAAAVSATWAPVARAQTYTLDPAKVGAQPWDTSTAIWDNGTNTPGAYDDLFANGASATSVIALLNSSAATTLTTAGTITLNQIQFAGANPNTTVAGTVSFLGTGTNTIDVVGGGTGTISAAVTAGTGLTKTGSGTLVLSGTNAITGGLTVTGGTVNYGAEGNLGGSGVTLNGGGVAYTGGNYTPTKAITVGAAGGTFNLTTNVKITGSLAGFITSATGTTGTLTRAGAANNVGNNFSLSGANSGFAGAWNFTGGVTEATSAAALGSSASTNTLTLNAGAELAASATTITQNLTINGGTLGGDNGTSTYSGAVTVNGPFNVRLGDFYQANVGRNLIISGPMTGTGAITLLSSNTYTAATVGAGQTLFLNGNNSGYTSSFNFVPGFNVAFGTAASVGTGTVTINSNASGLGGVGYGYDFGAVVPTFTNNRTGTTTGGVFGINTTLAATTTLDLSTLGGGGMYLGSQGTGTYAAATLTPDGTVYRLGGGGGTLTIANGVLVGANTVQIGDPLTATTTRANGAGTVVLAAANSYTGTTNIATGSVLSITNGGALGSTAAGTTAAAGGALSLSNNIVVAGEALTINGVVSTAAQTAGLVSAGGNNVFTANITANNTGTDNVRIASNTSAATLTLPGNIVTANAATSLVLQGAGNIVQTGVISGPAGLISTNSGAIYLSGANTYAGRTNVQTGRVLVTQIG
ncbi:MAG TPA: autotransporter-associated beta strand repeat-containing protein, partial [Humisphaera sp.]